MSAVENRKGLTTDLWLPYLPFLLPGTLCVAGQTDGEHGEWLDPFGFVSPGPLLSSLELYDVEGSSGEVQPDAKERGPIDSLKGSQPLQKTGIQTNKILVLSSSG